MIITISGKAGSGKSTIAKLIAKKLNLKHYSIGDLMRQVAKDRNVSLLELSKHAEDDITIDKDLDKKQIELGKNEKSFVIDGRLTAHFIPNADFKFFLDCDDKERAKRIFNDPNHDDKGTTVEETIEIIKKREKSEKARYKNYYDVDYLDKGLYNLIIDTTNMSIQEVVEEILSKIK